MVVTKPPSDNGATQHNVQTLILVINSNDGLRGAWVSERGALFVDREGLERRKREMK